MLPTTKQDASKATRRRVAGDVNVERQVSNVMARTSSGSQHRSMKKHSKKWASIGVIVIFMILMGILLALSLQIYKPKEPIMIEQSSPDVSGRTQVLTSMPILILHVGPAKTGSTTIQCGLQKHQNLLKQDNFYYIGKPCYLTNDKVLPIHFLPRELNGAYRQKPQLPKFEEIVSEHIEQGHNMIISSESFAHDDPSYWFTEKSSNRLQALFPGYHIQVVVVYRRLSSFVTSRYPNAFNEYAKGTGKSVLRDSWPTTNKTTSSDYMEDYARLPTISSYMQSIMSVAPEAFAYDSYIVYRYEDWMQRHPSVQAYRHIKQFFNVTILNMHISGDYFTNFLCLIPSLSQSCALFKRNNEHIVKNVKGDNEIDILDVNRLAVALFDKGLIKASTNCTRTHMIKLLEGYKISDDNERKTVWSLLDGGPKICPSQFLVRRLVNLTLAIESYLCPDWYKSHDGIISRKEFLGEMLDETSTKRSKYCNFDVEEIISRDVSRWEDIVETVTNY